MKKVWHWTIHGTGLPPSTNKHLPVPTTYRKVKGNFSSYHQRPQIQLSVPARGNESLPMHCILWFNATLHPINLFQLTATLSLVSHLAEPFTYKDQQQRHPGNSRLAMLFLHCLSCVCRILVCHISIISCVPTLYFMGTRRRIPSAINTQSSSWWRMNSPFYCLWLEGCKENKTIT